MDYRPTMNLPTTTFPMRAGLPQQEPRRVSRWLTERLYYRLRQARRDRTPYVLHDGPPYANGDIHMGQTLNKVLKDIINRYQLLEGRDVAYVPGYDTHGLPIEKRALETLGVSQHELDPLEIRKVCRDTALHYIGVMNGQFQRLGILGDWDNPYATLDPGFEASELRMFAKLVERGLIYKDFKSVYWCPSCETALAEAEIEYQNTVSPSIWVAFPVVDAGHAPLPSGTQAVIWTTTPWTIPANVAIAYHPELSYVVVQTERGWLLVAEALVDRFLAETGLTAAQRTLAFAGTALSQVVARHPYLEQDAPLVAGLHVTADQGTGLVHTAPGHGMEDFDLGKEYGLPVVQPLDDRGHFVDDTPFVGGLFYRKANAVVTEVLRSRDRLVHQQDITHQYPHCWRCKNPIIYRATEQWFFTIERIRDDLLRAVGTVEWFPAWAEERMRLMIRDRGDWCLSRQRTWGVPIPALHCAECGQSVMSSDFVEHFATLVEGHGAGIWWEWPVTQLVPEGFACACGSTTWEKEFNVFDVWMDSGATQAAVLARRPGLTWPADLVLEGGDQFRGWFNSLLTTAVGWRNQAPYKRVLTHGWVLDGQGRPMHKSLGNVIDPFELVDQNGADVVRLWVATTDFRGDVRVSADHLHQVGETYRKVRNTFRYLLGNLADFDPESVAQWLPHLDALDMWALVRLDAALRKMREAYRAYEFHSLVQELVRLCSVDLSNFYLDVVKDRLYTLRAEDPKRRATQAVLYVIARSLVPVIAPLIPFTAEEIYEHLMGAEQESVHFLEWPRLPEVTPRWQQGADLVERLGAWRELGLGALEKARQQKVIGNSLEARLTIHAPDDDRAFLASHLDVLQEMTMTAQIDLEPGSVAAEVVRTEYQKCGRCWRFVPALTVDAVCPRCAAVLQAGAAQETR